MPQQKFDWSQVKEAAPEPSGFDWSQVAEAQPSIADKIANTKAGMDAQKQRMPNIDQPMNQIGGTFGISKELPRQSSHECDVASGGQSGDGPL